MSARTVKRARWRAPGAITAIRYRSGLAFDVGEADESQ